MFIAICPNEVMCRIWWRNILPVLECTLETLSWQSWQLIFACRTITWTWINMNVNTETIQVHYVQVEETQRIIKTWMEIASHKPSHKPGSVHGNSWRHKKTYVQLYSYSKTSLWISLTIAGRQSWEIGFCFSSSKKGWCHGYPLASSFSLWR